jgi:hypothetical protein
MTRAAYRRHRPCLPGRHDEPEEQEQDRIRAEIRAAHRYDSFADVRTNNIVKWYIFPSVVFISPTASVLYRHIDGHDYMWALSEMLESAKEVIFILVSGMHFLNFLLMDRPKTRIGG